MEDRYAIGRRIWQLRKEKMMTLEQLGNKIGVNKATVTRYEKGYVQHIGKMNLEGIATALGTTVDYLMTGQSGALYPRIHMIRAVTGRHTAAETRTEEKIEDNVLYTVKDIILRFNSGKPLEKHFALVATDDALSPRIQKGDTIFFEQCDDAESGSIVLALHNGLLILRRIKKDGDILMLLPENHDYSQYSLTPYDLGFSKTHILGKAVLLQAAL